MALDRRSTAVFQRFLLAEEHLKLPFMVYSEHVGVQSTPAIVASQPDFF